MCHETLETQDLNISYAVKQWKPRGQDLKILVYCKTLQNADLQSQFYYLSWDLRRTVWTYTIILLRDLKNPGSWTMRFMLHMGH